jgi:hypothetical protein
MTISGHGPRPYHLPAESAPAFACTNAQTIAQRVSLLRELLPGVRAIGELCCGDCARQWAAYRQAFPDVSYRGLDLAPHIVAANQAQGNACTCGDALDPAILRPFLACDVLFFGPPLSQDCDGHNLLAFGEVTPSYTDFACLLWDDLGYQGTLVCICPNTTTMGDVQRLYAQTRTVRADVNLRLLHYSYATLTGHDEVTPLRLKYVELWFSTVLPDAWEVRELGPD